MLDKTDEIGYNGVGKFLGTCGKGIRMGQPAFKRLQLPRTLYQKIAASFIVHGADAATISYHTDLSKSKVTTILQDPSFHEYIAKVRSNPLDVIPDESTLYAMLWMEVKKAGSSRDRQAALRVLLEAKSKHSIGDMIEGYARPE